MFVFVIIISGVLSVRFVPDKQFAGTDRTQKRDGPVQFEKDEDDIFGLSVLQFLEDAKKGGSKRTAERDDRGAASSSRHDRKRERRE